MVVPQLPEPQVLKGVVAVGIVLAVVAENVGHVAGNFVVEIAKSVLRIKGKGNGDDLKEKTHLVRRNLTCSAKAIFRVLYHGKWLFFSV